MPVVVEPGETAIVDSVCETVRLTLLVTVDVPSLTVTRKMYVPALLNVTTVFLALLLPLTENVGDPPLGLLNRLHKYVSPDSPPSSAPSADNDTVVPVTVVVVAFAGEALVGAALFTVIVAVS